MLTSAGRISFMFVGKCRVVGSFVGESIIVGREPGPVYCTGDRWAGTEPVMEKYCPEILLVWESPLVANGQFISSFYGCLVKL